MTNPQSAPVLGGSGQALGLTLMIVSLLSTQIGNSFAKRLTEAMATPIGAVWMRMAFSAVVLLALAVVRWLIGRIARRRAEPPATTDETASPQRPREAWILAVAFGVSLMTMNSMFYEAIARIPVGIVVTIEFLGPLSVAVIGSRRPLDFIWVALAGLGVVILGVTPTPLTWAGVLFALGAGVCWALYILLGSRVTRHFQGVNVLTATCTGATIVLLPLFLIGGNVASLGGPSLTLGLVVALACTVLPYSLELAALKRLTTGLFGIVESLAPAIAALAAWLLLRQVLHLGDWLAIACIVAASFGASWTAARRARSTAVSTSSVSTSATSADR